MVYKQSSISQIYKKTRSDYRKMVELREQTEDRIKYIADALRTLTEALEHDNYQGFCIVVNQVDDKAGILAELWCQDPEDISFHELCFKVAKASVLCPFESPPRIASWWKATTLAEYFE